MKKSLNLNSTEWCDIVFEGKNKSYGAFELRQSSSKRHLAAFVIILIMVVFIGFLPSIISSINAATAKANTGGIDDVYSVVKVDNKIEEPVVEIEQPSLPEPPKWVDMQKFAPPVITEDEKVTDEEMLGMSELNEDKGVAIGAFNVENGSNDPESIRKEFERDVTGEGTGSGQGKKDEIFISAQFMPQFPGGESEMYRFIGDNLKYPIVDQEMGIEGRVTIRFVVTKTGDISDVHVIKGVSPSCDKEAVRVVKSMPKWIPGKNNGEPVQVYFTLPIVFRLKK